MSFRNSAFLMGKMTTYGWDGEPGRVSSRVTHTGAGPNVLFELVGTTITGCRKCGW